MQGSGEVINLPFDVSDIVKKGALVLELDPSTSSGGWPNRMRR